MRAYVPPYITDRHHTRGHIIATSAVAAVGVVARVPCRPPDTIRYLYRSVFVSIYGLRIDYPSFCSAYDCRPPFFFQMLLSQRFRDAVAGGAVNITALRIGTRYRVMHCDHGGTNYGDAMRLKLREENDNIVRVFLPRHYGSAILEDDVVAINTQRHKYYLTYKGNSAATGRPMLQMDV